MLPKQCKRLIEVDFPIGVVSAHAAREKSIRHGHPSTLHLWWARRPLAACRAVLLGLLLPDPCDENCPPEFKTKARELLAPVQGKGGKDDKSLRHSLLKFIGDFANWDMATNRLYLETARALVRAAQPEEAPVVVDPFAGGGSIPLEALRLGCEAFASDLNPVACFILKTLLEDIPRHGAALAEELRNAGARIKAEAERELSKFYPADPDGARPIAYLWARTVRCESAANCGAEIPLLRSFWLSKKANRRRALRYEVLHGKGGAPQIVFKVFTPKTDRDVPAGTVTRARARCLACGTPLDPERVRAQLAAQRGGADVKFDTRGRRTGGATLLAVVTLKEGEQGRRYRMSDERDYEAVFKARRALKRKASELLPHGLSPVPDEPTPAGGGSGAGRAFSVQKYGMLQWGDLFTARQKLALITLGQIIQSSKCTTDAKEIFSLVLNRVSSRSSSLASWRYQADQEKVEHTFVRQALPIVWDFAESVAFSQSTGSFLDGLGVVAQGVRGISAAVNSAGQVQQADACDSPLPDQSATVWFTDPPYYDAVPYADLSDFFFVWLKRTLLDHPLLINRFEPRNPLTPKTREIVQDETKLFDGLPKDRPFFVSRMAQAFDEGRRVLREDGIGCVVFAHKTTEGWEALLSGMIQARWTITASWPIATEMGARLRARESAALATSVHLVCRPRPDDAGVGDWADVLAEMQQRVRKWMPRLIKEGIRGADAIFACIGPAMENYSRHTRVETPAGRVVPLGGDPQAMEPHERGFLAYVFEAVSREALRQVLGDAQTEGFEEDARLTALFLWTLLDTRTNGKPAAPQPADEGETDADDADEAARPAKAGLMLPFDTFIRITRPMGIHYEDWLERIISIEKGVVRLIPVAERDEQLFGERTVAGETWTRGAEQTLLPGFDAGQGTQLVRRVISSGGARRLDSFTMLDSLHRAMLLFAGGQTTRLKQLLEDERQRGRRFEQLAFALTPLYGEKTNERRWLEGVQSMIKR
jgi:adenine-specific DNA methylase